MLEAQNYFRQNEFLKAFHVLEKLLPQLKLPGEKLLARDALSLSGSTLRNLGLPTEAIEFFITAASLAENNSDTCAEISDAIFTANCAEDFSAEDFQRLYAEYKKYLTDIKPYPRKFYNHKKIRVGFISANFQWHVVMSWSWALLTELDKKFFDVYCYSNSADADEVTAYMRKINIWRDISALSDAHAAQLIRDDEIDILFDLSGHTLGNRLRVADYRPASVQISGIGYMNSTGLDCFDYFLSDIYCGGDENFFTEKLIRLPRIHICYEPPTKTLEPAAEPPCLKKNFITFGCFNSYAKITDTILVAWKKILDKIPNSRLILKHKIYGTSDGKKFVGERLKRLGFDLARIEMRAHTANHLIEYGDIDIALDTFPYTGGVTTCEALFMGVPVVSLYGNRHGTRFGLSILKNIGLEELATDSIDEYINRAAALAGDKELISILRKNLRGMMIKSALMNSELYLRDIEEALIKILAR